MKRLLVLLLVTAAAVSILLAQRITADPLAANRDTTVKPGDDFFHYANGTWFMQHPIPPSESSNGLWQIIQDTVNAQVRTICESSAKIADAPRGSNKQKIGDFFRSGMDSAALNLRGLADLKEELAAIDAVTSLKGIVERAAHLHMTASSPFFRFGVAQDDRISSKHALFIGQGGLSLPNRRFYFDTDARAVEIRAQFITHLSTMFRIMGYDTVRAAQAAVGLMKLETALAQSSRKLEDTRDPVKNYNKMPFRRLKASMPNFDWSLFLKTLGLPTIDTVIVGQPEFLYALNNSLQSFSIREWKEYLRYSLVRGLARFLDDRTALESFHFYSTVLRGVPEQKPRWERVVQQTDNSLGDLIGQVYVTEYLPAGTKEKLLEIGTAIKNVYAARIKNLDWMSNGTKVKALAKLDKVIMKVGYPDHWKDLRTMQIDASSYARNAMNANAWYVQYNLSKFGKPVDRTEWDMQPQTYNAYYNPSNNEICVPGCNIIVPGFERVMADDAILYSIIGGSTFGHEMTHGFDDQGCQYDEQGNLNNWWTTEDSSKFFAKTKMIVEQFNNYVAVDSLHINGEQTQGENIADLAGVILGYEAFKGTKQFREKQMIAGLTPDERYFLAYGFAWMINMRPESIANLVKSDVHSPAQFRVIGPLMNIPEVYTTFHISPTDKMYRPEHLRVAIW